MITRRIFNRWLKDDYRVRDTVNGVQGRIEAANWVALRITCAVNSSLFFLLFNLAFLLRFFETNKITELNTADYIALVFYFLIMASFVMIIIAGLIEKLYNRGVEAKLQRQLVAVQ